MASVDEPKNTGVTLTVLEPGMTDTHVFETAGMEPGLPPSVGKKDDPADVAQAGFDAMQKGEAEVTSAANNKIMETVEGCCSTRWWRRRTAR